MPAIMKISPQGQIRIPNKIMKLLNITKGDYVEVDIKDSDIILKPRKLIDPSQEWCWTKEWQKMEACINDEIEKGLVSPTFKTAKEGLKWLKK